MNSRLLLAVWLLLPTGVVAETLAGRVVGVSDGDTITVLAADHETHKIRLAGIDAPEKAQPFGQRAKERLSDLVFGKSVAVEWSKRDRYQRIVGKVLIANQDAGLTLVTDGLAWHYKKYQKEQTPDDQARYAAAEEASRARHAGLWIDPDPVPPWEWRARKRAGDHAAHAAPYPATEHR